MLLLVGMVITRVQMLRRRGVQAMQFGKLDKTDFLIPPFALLYFYMVFSPLFWPPAAPGLAASLAAWAGVLACLAGLLLMLWSLVSFGRSFRVGIDTEHPDQLVTGGAFGLSRNPIYTAFGLVLLGQVLIHPAWGFLIYLAAGIALFHRQVLREEAYLKGHYGQAYLDYCSRVRRYL